MRTGRVVAVVAAAVGACLEACHKDATGLTPNDVAGHYVAATFTTTQAGTSTDQLARGSFIDLTLVEGGGSTGRLFIRAPKPGTADFDASLAGTWTLAADTVTLTHAANTFLRDMPLRVTGARLAGDKAFSGVQIVVVLQKQ